MTPVEAMTILIGLGDGALKLNSTFGTDAPELSESEERLQLAVSVAQAILNTAVPVARFRCFVKIESGREEGREFTICSPNIEDIVAALYPLSTLARKVYVTLWEQRPTGADMIEAYQGWTRARGEKRMHVFLNQLQKYAVTIPSVH